MVPSPSPREKNGFQNRVRGLVATVRHELRAERQSRRRPVGHIHRVLRHHRRGGLHHPGMDRRHDDVREPRSFRPVEQLLLRQRRDVRRRGLPGQAGRPVRHTEHGPTGGRHPRRRVRLRRRGDRGDAAAVLLLPVDHRVPDLRMVTHFIRFVLKLTVQPRQEALTY